MSDRARVRLRDVTLEDADTLDAWSADPSNVGGFNDLGEPRGRSIARRWPAGRFGTNATAS